MRHKILKRLVILRNHLVFKYFSLMSKISKRKLPTNEKATFIVSIASYPKRDHLLPAVFQALSQQTLLPKKWILVLTSNEYPNGVPTHLHKLQKRNLEIVWVRDNSFAVKKLVPVVEKYPDLGIVTLDDDIIYSKWLLKNLVDNNYARQNMIVGHSAKSLYRLNNKLGMFQRAAKTIDESTPSKELYFLGIGGIFYPPNSLHNKVLDLEAIKQYVPGRGSDMWFWAGAILQGSKHKCVSFPKASLNFGIPIPENNQTKTREAPTHEELDGRFQRVIDYFGIREHLTQTLPNRNKGE